MCKNDNILGCWINMEIILSETVKRYIKSINLSSNDEDISIDSINDVLEFLESAMNNTFEVCLGQKITISKLSSENGSASKTNN